MNFKNSGEKIRMRNSIIIPMTIIFSTIIIIGTLKPNNLYTIQNKIATISFSNFGWLFQITAAMFTCIWLTISKYRSIKLCGEDAKPTLSY